MRCCAERAARSASHDGNVPALRSLAAVLGTPTKLLARVVRAPKAMGAIVYCTGAVAGVDVLLGKSVSRC